MGVWDIGKVHSGLRKEATNVPYAFVYKVFFGIDLTENGLRQMVKQE